MIGAIHLLPNTPSRRGAQSEHRDNLTLLYLNFTWVSSNILPIPLSSTSPFYHLIQRP